MEALTGASIAGLADLEMCKALLHDILTGDLLLLAKDGGKRDFVEVKA